MQSQATFQGRVESKRVRLFQWYRTTPARSVNGQLHLPSPAREVAWMG